MDLWRDTSRILNTEAPRRAALVRKPLRSECRDPQMLERELSFLWDEQKKAA
jgi:hypothetical protein